MSLLSYLGGLLKLRRSQADAEQPGFCSTEFPEMWQGFVDHVVDAAYTKACPGEAPREGAAQQQQQARQQCPQPSSSPSQQQPHALHQQQHHLQRHQQPQSAKEQQQLQQQQQQQSQEAGLATRLPPVPRLVAIGDLHGDLAKAQRAFRLAGLTNADNHWEGGSTVCVQVGDILDRGDQELRILYFLERLQQEAQQQGGRLHVLNGNHETMNVGGNYRYATPGASIEMEVWRRWQQLGNRLRQQCNCSPLPGVSESPGEPSLLGKQALNFNPMRHAALKPGGPIATRFFAPHPTVLQVGSTLFVHGGVLGKHVEYGLNRINTETQQWLLGRSGDTPPAFLRGANAVVWARDFSMVDERQCDCEGLKAVLENVPGAQRMVVGHTIQEGRGINAACGGRVIRVDVGMSAGCGNGEVEVLEIVDDKQVWRLREGREKERLSTTAPAAATPALARDTSELAQGPQVAAAMMAAAKKLWASN